MSSDTIQTLVRTALKMGGAILIQKGVTTDPTWEAVVGGVVATVGIIWGILHKKPAAPAQ
jgi:hypothetical protein